MSFNVISPLNPFNMLLHCKPLDLRQKSHWPELDGSCGMMCPCWVWLGTRDRGVLWCILPSSEELLPHRAGEVSRVDQEELSDRQMGGV